MPLQMLRPALALMPMSDREDPGERFTRALVTLTRTVWSPDCTFETAIAAICETAAEALRIERVSVWRYEAGDSRLRCLHAYDAMSDMHAPPDTLEILPLDEDDYIASLGEARTLELAELEAASGLARSHSALRDYLQRHRVQGLLDAPAFVGGELQGVICHESVLGPRAWSRADATFAASMGDYVAMAFEIARRRRAEAEVEHLRLHDVATGLPNRAYMTELVRQRLLAMPHRSGEVVAVLHVQLDMGVGVAWSAEAPSVDAVLGHIGQRLRAVAGPGVELARTGTEGFGLIVGSRPGTPTVIRLAEGIVAAFEAMDWQHVDLEPSIAIGIALADPGEANDAPTLLRQAEEAATQAGAGERSGYAVYDSALHVALVEALRTERALREGFARGEFELHYQPEYDARTQRWTAAEALLRWRVDGRLIPAGDFIGVLEPSRSMLAVGGWVLAQACRDAAYWPPNAQGEVLAVRVNVSARQFDEPGLVDAIRAALAASGLDAARLSLELTETTLMRDVDVAHETLCAVRALGVHVAIDDFGIGYASLVYLKRLPIDALKIDRSFVQGLPRDAGDTAIIQAIVSLAAAFGIDVVAEGVETEAQQDALLAAGVHRMQGWLYSRALSHAALCTALRSRDR
ncbi:putative bifunctional diguanylate cyclase/phosphodiesterase [Luteimonas sp. WGS1318]|uniref:putative bifunctional diguanylate cyclase/phosphodiesterase n=1 Tax=Luteimonas sp. WGS1318 TaxID=3366815 RepID=UPI00372D6582